MDGFFYWVSLNLSNKFWEKKMKTIVRNITSLALGSTLLASCGAKSNEDGKTDSKSERKLTIGIVQIVDHPYSCMTNP